MNAIRQTQQLNKRELENATPPSASWHTDYRDTAYIYIGGLPLDLSEGDVVTIFSQYGNPTHLNMIRDKETGKSKGFAFLKYEDQRSCDLAVDNLGGAEVLGRLLRVDHTRYKKKDDEDETTYRIDRFEQEAEPENESRKRGSDTDDSDRDRRKKRRRHMLREEQELEELLAIKENGEEEDPMREYLIKEKREEVERAKEKEKHRGHRHKHHKRDADKHENHEQRKHRHRSEHEDESAPRKHGRDRGDGERTRYRDDEQGDRDRRKYRDHNSDNHIRDRRRTEHSTSEVAQHDRTRRRRESDSDTSR